MTDGTASEDGERFAYWSGYTPGKRTAEGTVIPLDVDELTAEAARFRRGADRATTAGELAKAERLRRAAADLERRADGPG